MLFAIAGTVLAFLTLECFGVFSRQSMDGIRIVNDRNHADSEPD